MGRRLFLKVTVELTDFDSFKNMITIEGDMHEELGYTKSNLMKILSDIVNTIENAIEPYLKEHKKTGDE